MSASVVGRKRVKGDGRISKINNCRGFTLVEIIIAVGILAVVSAIVLEMFVYAANTQAQAKDLDNALAQVRTVIETYKANPAEIFTSAETGDGFEVTVYFDKDWQETPDYTQQGYSLLIDADAADGLGMQRLTVTAVRHAPYLMQDEGGITLLSLSAQKYVRATSGGGRP